MHRLSLLALLLVCLAVTPLSAKHTHILQRVEFKQTDSILVIDSADSVVFEWLPDTPRTPASVVKMLTAQLAINTWGLNHQFETHVYQLGDQIWVKGLGDPMLVSEEIALFADALKPLLPKQLCQLNLDSSLFADPKVPGRGSTDDPYNAPLSALAANFNTVNLKKSGTQLLSAEAQTPLTATAIKLAKESAIKSRSTRINLQNADTAQRQFGEILLAKLGIEADIEINKRVPADAKLLYRHKNTATLREVLRGTLEYSNNFIANQLFLLLGANSFTENLNFDLAAQPIGQRLNRQFGWPNGTIVDGAGLSRANRLTAKQVLQVLNSIESNQELLRRYVLRGSGEVAAYALAKSGSMRDVHALAGFLYIGQKQYRFVFMFNRAMPYDYRERLLQQLADELTG